jgi:periplasmic divalent cation tolerance protein
MNKFTTKVVSLCQWCNRALALPPKTLDCNGMPEQKLILSTASSQEEASKIATALVEEKLAACVNIVGPIASIYRWQGSVESAQEFLLLIKTTAAMSGRVQARVRELHSYELPEAIEVDIAGGSGEYLRWITESVG